MEANAKIVLHIEVQEAPEYFKDAPAAYQDWAEGEAEFPEWEREAVRAIARANNLVACLKSRNPVFRAAVMKRIKELVALPYSSTLNSYINFRVECPEGMTV